MLFVYNDRLARRIHVLAIDSFARLHSADFYKVVAQIRG